MNDKQERESWIHVETSSQPHSWKQTWMFLGGAAVVFAFALLYEIDKDLQYPGSRLKRLMVSSHSRPLLTNAQSDCIPKAAWLIKAQAQRHRAVKPWTTRSAEVDHEMT